VSPTSSTFRATRDACDAHREDSSLNPLRKLYASIGVAVLLTVFWVSIPVAFVVVVTGVSDEWSDVQWLLLFLATAGVTALIIFLWVSREERADEARSQARRQEEDRVAAIPPEVRLETTLTSLELAQEVMQQTRLAHRRLRLHYESSEPMSYQRADEALKEARRWIDEATSDIQHEAAVLGDVAAGTDAVSSSQANELSAESVHEAIARAREALGELSDSIAFSFAINAAEDALGSAQVWADEALPRDSAQQK
jgi:hypothetical protein